MNHSQPPEDDLPDMSRDELMSALFANMVIQQSNLALMFLGKAPHPETGQPMLEPESARMMIDQLEMLEFKTRGNLDKRETALLQQSLTTLRMAFVEAIEPGEKPSVAGPKTGVSPTSPSAAQPIPPAGASDSAAAPGPSPTPSDEEPRKKFSKKY
ncbi:MAG: DUF1844 domain-containing protein [Limisphaerales bacterium]